MTVYVDNSRVPFRGMLMCHMVADSTAELLAMVDRIGVGREHIQMEGTEREHFDICVTKRRHAIRAGARPVNQRELVGIIRQKRKRMEA